MELQEFEDLVLEALENLPEEVIARMDNIDVVVKDWPTREQMEATDTENRYSLLGLYEGVPLTERGYYNMVLPDRVNIFQRPIEAISSDKDSLVKEIRDTVLHEIAHHFGIDDDRLEELGI